MTTNVTRTERMRKRYHRIVNGCYLVAIAALLLGLFLGYELIGSVVYLVGVACGAGSGLYLRRRTAVSIVDERDERLLQKASFLAMTIFAGVGLAVFPVLFVLDAAGHYAFTPVAEGVLYTCSALGLLWGACCLVVEYTQ